jgi:hypothetical protein
MSIFKAEIKGYKITYSSGCFMLTNALTNEVTSFYQPQEELYTYKVETVDNTMVQTVDKNEQAFNPPSTLKIQGNLGTVCNDWLSILPSYWDYLTIIKNRLLPSIKVIITDVINTKNIYRPDLRSIQGKTVCQHCNPLILDYIYFLADLI